MLQPPFWPWVPVSFFSAQRRCSRTEAAKERFAVEQGGDKVHSLVWRRHCSQDQRSGSTTPWHDRSRYCNRLWLSRQVSVRYRILPTTVHWCSISFSIDIVYLPGRSVNFCPYMDDWKPFEVRENCMIRPLILSFFFSSGLMTNFQVSRWSSF